MLIRIDTEKKGQTFTAGRNEGRVNVFIRAKKAFKLLGIVHIIDIDADQSTMTGKTGNLPFSKYTGHTGCRQCSLILLAVAYGQHVILPLTFPDIVQKDINRDFFAILRLPYTAIDTDCCCHPNTFLSSSS